jgi:hypothetical protein
MIEGISETASEKSKKQKRHADLTTIYNQNLTALRDVVATLPKDIRSQLADQIEVMDCSHQALLSEFGRKP